MSLSPEPRPKLWTRAAYERLGDLGVFLPDERVELIEGAILAMTPQNLLHTRCISRLTTLLVGLFSQTHYVRVQLPLALGELSAPEPDLALVPLAAVDGPEVRDNPSQADLVIEVSDSSLAFDRGEKAGVYAKAGLPEYWIINLRSGQLEVYRDPAPLAEAPFGYGYRSRVIHGPEDSVRPLFQPGTEVPLQRLF